MDLAKFARISAAKQSAEAAAHRQEAIAREAEAHREPALDSFISNTPFTPAVRAAISERSAAERGATAQHLALVPSLSGGASERYTNAVGFLNGHDEAYVATLSLVWGVDFATAPAIRSRNAEADAARAREEQVGLTVGDGIFRA
jgi:hypothetical protein